MRGRLFRRWRSLLLENLGLRQQLVTLKRRHPRPMLDLLDKLFLVIARSVWSAWKDSLILVIPETVVRWHRTAFRMYWRLISRVPLQALPRLKNLFGSACAMDLQRTKISSRNWIRRQATRRNRGFQAAPARRLSTGIKRGKVNG
jgi:hypothetical protein